MKSTRLYMVNIFFRLLPPTRCWALKRVLLRWAGAVVGPGVRIVSSVRVHMTGKLSIGADSFLGHEVMIVGGGESVQIGERVDVAPRVLIVTGSHELGIDEGRAAGKGISRPIVIGDGTWVGAGSTILGGVKVGALCVIAAGSVVRADSPSRVLLAGVPARVVRAFENDREPNAGDARAAT